MEVGWRYLLRHRWQSALMVLGIALGVAVVVAIDLANASAGRAFDLSTETLTGKATHQIDGGPQGLDEQVFAGPEARRMERPGCAGAERVYFISPQLGGLPMQLLGIDPFVGRAFSGFSGRAGHRAAGRVDARSLTRPGAVLLARTTGGALWAASLGGRLRSRVNGREQAAFVAGLLDPADALQAALAGRGAPGGYRHRAGIDRADRADSAGWICYPRPEATRAASSDWKPCCPRGLLVEPAEARSAAVEQHDRSLSVEPDRAEPAGAGGGACS